MRQVNSTDFKTHFGEFVGLVRDEPIEVLRGQTPVGVFLSPAEYEYLQKLEDLYWVARAKAAELNGSSVSHEEAIQILTQQLTRSA
jgi:PHD/YefM family antitoxin component YafN of YafNO toxin-antitoxin module